MEYVIGFVVSSIGVAIYIALENKKARDSKPISGIERCHRCYNGYDKKDLGKVWHINYAPIRMIFMDFRDDLNKDYCRTCRVKINIFMVLSLFITVPIILLFSIVVLGQLGLLK